MNSKAISLETAYALKTPEDNRALYRDWADTYDTGFSAQNDYVLPDHVAEVFCETPAQGLILDAGAGTGLLVESIFRYQTITVDALDISRDMLNVAASKNLYQKTIVADLTQKLIIPDDTYDGIVSSGTFTHGHVGPDALDELLRIAKPNAHFVLAINAKHFEAQGFGAKLTNLSSQIWNFTIQTKNIGWVIWPISSPSTNKSVSSASKPRLI